MAYSMPDDARFIVAGLSIRIRQEGARHHCMRVPLPGDQDSSEKKNLRSAGRLLRDQSGDEVARATLQTLVGPKRR